MRPESRLARILRLAPAKLFNPQGAHRLGSLNLPLKKVGQAESPCIMVSPKPAKAAWSL